MIKIIKRKYWGIPDDDYDSYYDEFGDYYNSYEDDGNPTYPINTCFDEEDEYDGI